MDIQYLGEHLWPGMLGRFLVALSFIFALFSLIFYLFSFYSKTGQQKILYPLGRIFYFLHILGLFSAAFILYYLIFYHYFEYAYVWQYSSRSSSLSYIISCFWAGQEGSFLIWAMAQSLFGLILIFTAGKWEKPAMIFIALSQLFLTSMLLGINIFGIRIGENPFILLRESIGSVSGTIFSKPDYLSMITDGNGMNPLLENFWMTIHPPMLFLGYAASVVPFAYGMASLLMKDYSGWIRPVLPWILTSLFFLGAGILLGGAWAYVSLTFGGFWSWDPVENLSLVPWMTLIAGLHFLLTAKKQHYSLFFAYLFIGLSYVLVLYASFLTRSGMLADSSAHAFGDNGMKRQLLLFLLIFLALMIFNIFHHFRAFHEKRNDSLFSREFWIFTGAIVMVMAAFQILFSTSIPVVNSILGIRLAPPVDRSGFYILWQLPFAMLIAGLIGSSQYHNMAVNQFRTMFRHLFLPITLTALLCFLLVFSGVLTRLNYLLLMVFILFAMISSFISLFFKTSGQKNMGAGLTHIGFLFFLAGVVLTFSNATILSSNTSRYNLGDERSNAENLMLVRHDTLSMSGFFVTYVGHTRNRNLTEYQLDFLKFRDGKYAHEFSLYPSVNSNPSMGNVHNPDTKHFLSRDYYTYISQLGENPDYIVIKVIMNPYINILWGGALLMLLGFMIAMRKRMRSNDTNNT